NQKDIAMRMQQFFDNKLKGAPEPDWMVHGIPYLAKGRDQLGPAPVQAGGTITPDPGEMVIAEAGAMMYMQDGIVMNTTLDPNAQGGGMMSKLFQGAKRALSGDTFFVTTFANAAHVRQDVAF